MGWIEWVTGTGFVPRGDDRPAYAETAEVSGCPVGHGPLAVARPTLGDLLADDDAS
ncbi:hypothetical protein [Streptomyces sp. NPDC001508]|uniref:hypothetical protein n=1 Tax=Streptomyces sp. NPDC001508 TaxID=3154656 RepID=UPI00332BDCF7